MRRANKLTRFRSPRSAPRGGNLKTSRNSEYPSPQSLLAAAFSFLKDSKGVVSWNKTDLTETLGIETEMANELLWALEIQGYVKRTRGASDEWLTTMAGESVSGSTAPRFPRESVEEPSLR